MTRTGSLRKVVSLKDRLLRDLYEILGEEDTTFRLEFGGYNPVLYGSYLWTTRSVTIYHLDSRGVILNYDLLLSILIHEYVHHLQYSDKDYTRVRGVMHDDDFWAKYNILIHKAVSMHIIEEVSVVERYNKESSKKAIQDLGRVYDVAI